LGGTGRTILFVSHNLSALQSICEYGLVLEHGKNAGWNTIGESVELYLSRMLTDTVLERQIDTEKAFASIEVRIQSFVGIVTKTF